MLPYEEHLRAGGAEFKIPESPVPPKPRGIRGRKPLPRGRKPGAKAKEKKMTNSAPLPPSSVRNHLSTLIKLPNTLGFKRRQHSPLSSSLSAGHELQQQHGGEERPRPAAGNSQQGHADRPGQATGSAAGYSQSGSQGRAAESSSSGQRWRWTNGQQRAQGKASHSAAGKTGFTDVCYTEIHLYHILSSFRLGMTLCYKYGTLSLK